MNSTNRAVNRILILLVGVVLMAVGAVAVAAVLVPSFNDGWADARGAVNDQISAWLQQTPLGDTGVSWVMPAVLVLLALGILVLVVFIVRQGRGHTRVALSEPTSEHGTTVVEAAVAEQALQDALGSRAEFVASHVSTYRVRRTPMLKISVTCRRGVSPRDAAEIVEATLRALDDLLGRPLPALVQIGGGFRARVTATTRLH